MIDDDDDDEMFEALDVWLQVPLRENYAEGVSSSDYMDVIEKKMLDVLKINPPR